MALLFYIGRWVGRVEQRMGALEDKATSETAALRREMELGDKAIAALVSVATTKG